MTKQEMKDYAVRNWGLEDPFTIELFQMDERGENESSMWAFIQMVEGMMADYYYRPTLEE